MKYSTAGEHILEIATDLLYAEGLGAVGVDRVAEQSGVSKPTLYTQFGSKDGLITAVLDRRRHGREQAIREYLSGLAPDTSSRVLALFEWFAEAYSRPGFRGCAFINAAAELPDPEHPARRVIAAHKNWTRELLAELAAADRLPNPQWWGSALQLLLDGAYARVLTTGDSTAIDDARAAATTIITAAGSFRFNQPDQLGREE